MLQIRNGNQLAVTTSRRAASEHVKIKTRWIVIEKFSGTRDNICNFAVKKFPGWHIVMSLNTR